MTIAEAQRDVRNVYLGGSVGQAVSATVWLVSSVCATWVGARAAIIALVLGGTVIFPLLTLVLKLAGRPSSLPTGHPMNGLATQTAFVIPFAYPVIGAAALHNVNWFYPAFMVVVGAHYLPFTFLYGMWQFVVLAVAMVTAAVVVGLQASQSFATGGWVATVLLFAAAAWLGASHARR
jgi:hypothetical protein